MPRSDLYGLAASGLPPDMATDARKVTRQEKIAQAMLQQAMQPLGGTRQLGRVAVAPHWLEGAAKLAQTYAAQGNMDRADQGFAGIGQRYQTGLADEVKRIAALRAGAPATSEAIVDEQAAGGEGAPATITTPAGPETPRAAIQAALLSQYAPVREQGKLEHATYEREQTRVGDREARLYERILALDAASQNAQIATADRAAAAKQAQDLRRELQESQQTAAAALAAENRKDRAATRRPIEVKDAAGNVKLYDDKGNLIKDLGKVGTPSGAHQKTQAAKKQLGIDLDRAISELESATKDGGLIDKSTGSGAGALVDIGASFVGKATPGAIAVGRMKPIYDIVLKMVPRFEGPQSDKDTKTYQDAAGQLANPAIPNTQKKAAGKEILRLMRERKEQFVSKDTVGTEADDGGAATPRVVDW